ncbi:MAG TPA: hypothetical protein VFG35_25465 [Actinoplanes sp.]|nr:hypothetical protein [Actinoplanes sp.]
MPQHEANRPFWNCLECRVPWPCQPARDRMAADGIDTSLRLAAWSLFDDAVQDMPHASEAELYERFIGWMRDVPATPSVERVDSPRDALKACEEIEHEHPEWQVIYSVGGYAPRFRAGFYAKRKGARRSEPDLFGASTNALIAAIWAWSPPASYGVRVVELAGTSGTESPSIPSLIGSHEIYERFGLAHDSWGEDTECSSFPRPVAILAQGCVWLTEDVDDWFRETRPVNDA